MNEQKNITTAQDTFSEHTPKRKRTASLFMLALFSVVLLIGVFSSTGCYQEKLTILEWLSTEEGKEYAEELQKSVPDENFPTFNYFAESDVILVAEYICKPGVTLDTDNINDTVDKLKPSYKKSIQDFMDKYDLKEFAIVIRYKNSDGKLAGERIITRNS